MKFKHLETSIRRRRLLAAFDEPASMDCPVCTVATGTVAPPSSTAKAETKALLLVSQDGGLALRLSRTASLARLTFAHVGDAAEALSLLNLNRPEVIFLDLDLPAHAGWEVAERFLQNELCPPLILLTGRTGHFDLNAAICAGAIVDKSAEPAQLLQKVSGILAEPAANRVDRQSRQRLLLRWLRPYDWPAADPPTNRFWGINE